MLLKCVFLSVLYVSSISSITLSAVSSVDVFSLFCLQFYLFSYSLYIPHHNAHRHCGNIMIFTIRFQMAEVLFNKGKVFAWFLHCIGGIYVNRDSLDMAFMSNTLEILDKGGTVGIFPEGRLPVNGKPWPFKPSIAYIASNTSAPIIPVYTDGNYGLKKRTNVMIGEPIDIHDYINGDELNKDTYAKLTAILEEKKNEMQAELERRLNKNGK